jgi:hypothetical protein
LLESDLKNKLPNIKGKENKTYGNVDKKANNQQKNLKKSDTINNAHTGTTNTTNTPLNKKEETDLKLELVGQHMTAHKNNQLKEKENKEAFSFNDQKESILLKPIPDNFFGNNEMKELAGLVRR